MRKNYKTILWVIAALTIPAFVWWGAGTASRSIGPTQGYAGQIENWKVSLEEYRSVYESLQSNLSDLFGGSTQIPRELLEDFAWTRLLMLHEAEKRKIRVTDEEVRDRIAKFTHFQKEGRFDPASYDRALGDQARKFEEQVRQDLILERLQNQITKDVNVTDGEVRKAYSQDDEKIQLGYTLIEAKLPEKKPVDQTEPLQAETSIEVAKIRQEAKARAQQTLNDIQKKIQEGMPLKQAFVQAAGSVTQTDTIARKGTLDKIGYQPGLLEKAFELDEGKLGEIAEIPEGFVLFWVEKKLAMDEKQFESKKSTYRERLLEQKKSDAFNRWLSELKTKTAIKSYLANLKN